MSETLWGLLVAGVLSVIGVAGIVFAVPIADKLRDSSRRDDGMLPDYAQVRSYTPFNVRVGFAGSVLVGALIAYRALTVG